MRKISPKWRALTGICAGLLLVLTQFQNCAPAGQESVALDDGQLRVIEDWATEKVNILANVVQSTPESDLLTVDGFCERKPDAGESLLWEVRGHDAAVLLSGEVICEGGGFRVDISGLAGMNCNEAYSLEVRTGDGSMDQAVVIRRCSL